MRGERQPLSLPERHQRHTRDTIHGEGELVLRQPAVGGERPQVAEMGNQEAAQAFQQATLLNPGWAEAFFNLGKMYRVLGRHQEAALALQRATLLKSNYSRAFFYLGLVWINLDRPNEAAAALIKAYDHDPGYFETYFDTTSYGIHGELGDKETILSLVHIIYPVNQQLAHIIYKRWTRHGINLRDFYEVVSGSDKKSEAGYQEAQESGYQEQPLPGYQKPPPAGFRR